jgi:hypothetical protein
MGVDDEFSETVVAAIEELKETTYGPSPQRIPENSLTFCTRPDLPPSPPSSDEH